jgi:hypothetical protein
MKTTHWEEDITPVHEDHDDAANSCEVGEIARYHENYGDDVVGHHLPMIFPTCFSIENKNLMSIEGDL